MKNVILPLVTFVLLMSCNEENPQPVTPFAGSWHLISEEASTEISFDVTYEGSGIYNYDATVVHPAIPEDQQGNNIMLTYDKFANGQGYGRIEITSRGPASQYKVVMVYNRFTSEGMSVYDVQIDIPSEPFIVLQDQIFTKAN